MSFRQPLINTTTTTFDKGDPDNLLTDRVPSRSPLGRAFPFHTELHSCV